MSEFLFSYGLFLAKIITGLLALLFAVAIVASGRKKEEDAKLEVTNLNDKFKDVKQQFLESTLDKKEFKALAKEQSKQQKKKDKASSKQESKRPKMYVLEFDGDIRASEVATLRDEITAVLVSAKPQDEVLLKLDNSGGMVHEHGLAASQLQRIKDANLRLTIVVDKVAASGGYMMACVADKILAAPFAIIGSIGVLAQLPNFNRLLDKAGIDFEQHTAGEYKRTVTMFGKNSEKEREKLQTELQETHQLFQSFITDHRSKLDIEKVATGEHWYGVQALELNLIDEIKTSDEFILQSLDDYDVYSVSMQIKKGLQEKLMGGLFSSAEKVKNKWLSRHNESNYL